MKIASATTTDIAPLAALWHNGWHEAHAALVPPDLKALRVPAEFRARVTAHLSDTFVARSNGQISGFVMVQDDELYQLYAAPTARGNGTAQDLIAFGEAQIAARYPIAWLACTVGNDRAARFYDKSGWTRDGVIDLALETSAGPFLLPVWRFEKDVTA